MSSASALDWSGADFQKSSRCKVEGTDFCVEVGAHPTAELVGVQDSKQEGSGPVLAFSPASFASFVEAMKSGRLDR